MASGGLPGLGLVPGSVLGSAQKRKGSSVRWAGRTGFGYGSLSAPRTMHIVLLLNEEESTWKEFEGLGSHVLGSSKGLGDKGVSV